VLHLGEDVFAGGCRAAAEEEGQQVEPALGLGHPRGTAPGSADPGDPGASAWSTPGPRPWSNPGLAPGVMKNGNAVVFIAPGASPGLTTSDPACIWHPRPGFTGVSVPQDFARARQGAPPVAPSPTYPARSS